VTAQAQQAIVRATGTETFRAYDAWRVERGWGPRGAARMEAPAQPEPLAEEKPVEPPKKPWWKIF
jgi:hypothetical protein